MDRTTMGRGLEASLKGCPLCDALNAADSPACFVCGWAGAFERDAETIGEALDGLARRCPEIVDAMLAETEARAWPEEPGAVERVRARIARTAAHIFTLGVRPRRHEA